MNIDGNRLLGDLRKLATFGKVGSGVNRLAFTAEDVAARQWLLERMDAAGLDARIDGLGNVYGQTPGATKAVVIGSHTDTVPNGGWLDGAMGVIYGLEVARSLMESGAEGGVDVVSFADEEGTFLGTLGARSFVGTLRDDQLAAAASVDGEALSEALLEAGYGHSDRARLDPARHVAYLEGHIEQGPRLEAEGVRIGVVTSIVGMRRMSVIFHGQADHAGTTPMAMRKDAGGRMIVFAHDLTGKMSEVAGKDTVWNFGRMAFEPGASNVVPQRAELLIEFRDIDMAVIDRIEAVIKTAVAAADGIGGVASETSVLEASAPAHMDPSIGATIEAAAEAAGVTSLVMPSGAGHDAMHLASHVSSGMLFIPSKGGRSHDTTEDSAEEDIVLGCQVMAGTVLRLLGLSE